MYGIRKYVYNIMYTYNILYDTRENKTRKKVVNYRCYYIYIRPPTAGALYCSYMYAIYGHTYTTHKTGLCRTRPRLHVKPTTPPPNALPVILLLLILLYCLIGVLV